MADPSLLPSSGARRALGLFAKQPVPGRVKTRLARETSPVWAARVAEALLRDSVEHLAEVEAERWIAFTPAEAGPFFTELAGDRFRLVRQAEGDLGTRMAGFIAERLAEGATAIVLVGADSPSLPRAVIDQAFAELDRADLVLGPAADGGYYLVGCRGPQPIFEGIAWGSDTVLAETIARLEGTSARLAVLPPWYDIDTLTDWQALRGHLAALARAGIDPGLPHVRALAGP